MAINTVASGILYNCDGATVIFPITFEYLDAGNIKVVYVNGVTFENITLVENTDYTIANDEVQTVQTYPIGDDIFIGLEMPFTQTVDLLEKGRISADVIEGMADELTLMCQENRLVAESVVALGLPETPTPDLSIPPVSERANKYLAFDASGDVTLVSLADPGSVSFSAYGESLVAAVDAAAARSLLDVSYMQGNTTVNITAAMTVGQIQAAIDAEPKDLNGYTLTISFAAGTYSYADDIDIRDFRNGTVEIMISTSGISFTSTSRIFYIQDCDHVDIYLGSNSFSSGLSLAYVERVTDFSVDGDNTTHPTIDLTGASGVIVQLVDVLTAQITDIEAGNSGGGSFTAAISCTRSRLSVSDIVLTDGELPNYSVYMTDSIATFNENDLQTGSLGKAFYSDSTAISKSYVDNLSNQLTKNLSAQSWSVVDGSGNSSVVSVAYSPTLDLLVEFLNSSSSAPAWYSKDGQFYTQATTSFTLTAFHDCIWVSQLSLYVAVATANSVFCVYTSPDGDNWTQRTCASTGALRRLATNGSIVVAVGTGEIFTSTDGITWTSRTAPDTDAYDDITYGGGLFVAVADDGSPTGNGAMTSPDGITWTSRTMDTTRHDGVAYSPSLGLFVAIGAAQGSMETSPDGITWTVSSTYSGNGYDIDWSDYLGFFAIPLGNQKGSNMIVSTDGVRWIPCGPDETGFNWQRVVSIEERGQFFGSSSNGVPDHLQTPQLLFP